MTDTNPRPWRERITFNGFGALLVDGVHPSVNTYDAARIGLLDEAHDLAAEVERLRAASSEVQADAERAWAEVERLRTELRDATESCGPTHRADQRAIEDLNAEVGRLRTLLATPADGPLRVERGEKGRWATLQVYGDDEVRLTDVEADAIEAQLAARPTEATTACPDGTCDGCPDPDACASLRPTTTVAQGGFVLAPPTPARPDDDAGQLLAIADWLDEWDRRRGAEGQDGIQQDLRRIAASLPATHDLPDGVQPWTAAPIEIDGVPVVGVAMGDVVQGLSDDEWLRAYYKRRWCPSANGTADSGAVYLLGRKPTPEPQTVTVELPQDVAERLASDANVRHRWTDVEATIAACRKALGR